MNGMSEYEKLITVANCRGAERTARHLVYVGRGDTPPKLTATGLGNPFSVHDYGRAVSIYKYEGRLFSLAPDSREWRTIRNLARKLILGESVQLFCWCAPKACHAEVIKREVLKTVRMLLSK